MRLYLENKKHRLWEVKRVCGKTIGRQKPVSHTAKEREEPFRKGKR